MLLQFSSTFCNNCCTYTCEQAFIKLLLCHIWLQITLLGEHICNSRLHDCELSWVALPPFVGHFRSPLCGAFGPLCGAFPPFVGHLAPFVGHLAPFCLLSATYCYVAQTCLTNEVQICEPIPQHRNFTGIPFQPFVCVHPLPDCNCWHVYCCFSFLKHMQIEQHSLLKFAIFFSQLL